MSVSNEFVSKIGRAEFSAPTLLRARTSWNLRRLIDTLLVSVIVSIPYFYTFYLGDSLQLQHHYSYADIMVCAAVVIAFFSPTVYRQHFSSVTVCCIGVALSYVLSAWTNNTFSNGSFLTFTRVWLAVAVLYQVVSGLCSDESNRHLLQTLTVGLSLVLLVQGATTVGAEWEHSFDQTKVVLEGTNLNSLGLAFVLLFTLSAIRLIESRKWWMLSLVGLGSSLIGITVTFSRGAYTAFGLILAIGVLGARAKWRTRAIAMVAALLAGSVYVAYIATRVFPGAAEFLEMKRTDYVQNLAELRWSELTVAPIKEWWDTGGIGIVVGDGASYQHSILSNSLVMTGIVGMICIVLFYWCIGRSGFKCRPLTTGEVDRARIVKWVLVGTSVAMFAQDCATNLINHSPFIATMFVIVMAAGNPYAAVAIESPKAGDRWIRGVSGAF